MLSVSADFSARSGCMLLGGGRLFVVLSSLVVMVTYSAAAMADCPATPEDGLNFLPHEVLSEITPLPAPPAAFRRPNHHYRPRHPPHPTGPPAPNQIRGRVVPGQHGNWSGYSGMTSAGTGVFLPKPRAYVAAAVPLMQNRCNKKKGGCKGNVNVEPSFVKKTGEANYKQVSEIEKEKEEFFEYELQKDMYLLLPKEWSYLPV